MKVELSGLHKILKDPTRREILKCLNDKGPLPYGELMDLAKVTNTGRFNYHLKVLGDLIEKLGDGRYALTERGRLAVQMLDEFPERAVQTRDPKDNSKKLLIAAAILLAGIIAISILLILMATNVIKL
jgi:DNA-binding transcriptional ArsR family regulator